MAAARPCALLSLPLSAEPPVPRISSPGAHRFVSGLCSVPWIGVLLYAGDALPGGHFLVCLGMGSASPPALLSFIVSLGPLQILESACPSLHKTPLGFWWIALHLDFSVGGVNILMVLSSHPSAEM